MILNAKNGSPPVQSSDCRLPSVVVGTVATVALYQALGTPGYSKVNVLYALPPHHCSAGI